MTAPSHGTLIERERNQLKVVSIDIEVPNIFFDKGKSLYQIDSRGKHEPPWREGEE
jgi:hypothetical protein